MFVTSAYAQAAGGATDAQSLLLNLAPMFLIILVFWFLLFRPQQQKAKELQQRQASMRRGDRVVTGGGVIGTISRVINDEEVEIQIAENVRVRVLRSTIPTILSKPEPAGREASETEDAVSGATVDEAAKKRRSSQAK